MNRPPRTFVLVQVLNETDSPCTDVIVACKRAGMNVTTQRPDHSLDYVIRDLTALADALKRTEPGADE